MTPLSRAQLEYLVQLIHPNKRLSGLPGQLDDVALAGLFGADAHTYREIMAGFAHNAQRAAADLLADAEFAAQVDRLPFKPGCKIIALGDSLTDDSQSWFEILRSVCALRRPGDAINFVNAGISAETTTEIFKRFIEVIWQRPDWIIGAAGANDTWYWTEQPLKLSVSLDETEKNLAAMRAYAGTGTAARWVWMTPPPMIPELVTAHWYQGAFQMMTSNTDLQAIADFILRQDDPVLDLRKIFGSPGQRELYKDDGLHPSLLGHCAIVRGMVDLLASPHADADAQSAI
jgi:acyl-CoA thioesterase I